MNNGDIFNVKCGELMVINYQSCRNILVEFKGTGTKVTTQAVHIRDGSVKDKLHPSLYGIGFIGYGKYRTTTEKGGLNPYNSWRNMMRRCYCPVFALKNTTYANVSVCDEWHNFQNFASWFYGNYDKSSGKHCIDKDINSSEIKVYSPTSCLFVNHQQNNEAALSKSYKLTSPLGVVTAIFNLSKFCRANDLDGSSMNLVSSGKQYSHKGWTKC